MLGFENVSNKGSYFLMWIHNLTSPKFSDFENILLQAITFFKSKLCVACVAVIGAEREIQRVDWAF